MQILDALIANAGKAFQRSFSDEPLLERLRIAATDNMSDPEVRAKCKILFAQWALNYKDTQGLQGIASLYRQLPQRRRPQPKPRDPSPDDCGRSPISPISPVSSPLRAHHGSSSASTNGVTGGATGSTTTHSPRNAKGKKNKHSQFNLEKEKPALLQALASVSIATTNLSNALKLINREKERPSENKEVMAKFEACKELRRTVLRYIQHVESEQFLGSLIHANEELVDALMLFMNLDKPIEEDSDSDEDGWNKPDEDVAQGLEGLSLGDGKGKGYQRHDQEPHHSEEVTHDDDPDNPFADANEADWEK